MNYSYVRNDEYHISNFFKTITKIKIMDSNMTETPVNEPVQEVKEDTPDPMDTDSKKESEAPENPPKTEQEAMLLALQADIRALRDTLNAEKKQKERAEEIVSKVQARESDKYSRKFDEEIKPFLADLAKNETSNPEISSAIDNLTSNIESVIKKTGFVGNQAPKEEQMYTVLSACASAQKINSSTLAKILKSEAEWGQKVQEKTKELEASKNEIEKLKAELEKLSNDTSNPVNHFKSDVPKAAPPAITVEAPVIQAVAHSEKSSTAPPPLFDLTPNTNWRSMWRSA